MRSRRKGARRRCANGRNDEEVALSALSRYMSIAHICKDHKTVTTNRDTLETLLNEAGIRGDAIAAVMRVDAVMQQWRRNTAKRELSHRAVASLGLGLELAQLDVLFAIAAPAHEFGGASGETMVGTVAERLGIDPSRASRVVADMVNAGYARRSVSQADARRTVLEHAPLGQAVVDAVQAYKWLVLGDFFSGWSPEDVARFVPLIERFTDWTDTARDDARFAADIARLAGRIDSAREEIEPLPA